MSADLRRFSYSLEPVRRLRQIQLDVLRAQLGQMQQQVNANLSACELLREKCDEQSRLAAQMLAQRADANNYAGMLRWLAQLHERIYHAKQALSESQAQRDALRERCLALQQNVEVIENHRDECLKGFARVYDNLVSKENDRDWLSRRSVAAHLQENQAGGVK